VLASTDAHRLDHVAHVDAQVLQGQHAVLASAGGAFHQRLHRIAERGGVLFQLQHHFRVDQVGREQQVGVLRQTLAQHDQVVGARHFAHADVRVGQLAGELFGNFLQVDAQIVNVLDVFAHRHQVLLQRQDLPDQGIELLPLRVELLQRVARRAAGGGQVAVALGQAGQGLFKRGPAFGQLLEGVGVAEHGQLGGQRQSLRQHLQFTRPRFVTRAVVELDQL
jgi:hypothetical protein